MTMDLTIDTPARSRGPRRPRRTAGPRTSPPQGRWRRARSSSSSGRRRSSSPAPPRACCSCFIFRYVFGGAVAHTGSLDYVDFLVPGFVVTGVLFQGMGAASGVATDLEGGLFDRLRSLPIRLLSIISGRVGADSALVAWGVLVMTAVGFAVGFRLGGSTRRRTGGARAHASSTASPSSGCSSRWASWPAARRRRRDCPSSSSRSASCRRPTCRCRPCPVGCRASPRTSP